MTKLEYLYLGLYLSDAFLIEDHVDHTNPDLGGRGALSSFPMCKECGEFREETEKRERLVSLELSKALPSLITIRWDTLFPPSKGRDFENVEYDEAGFYFQKEGFSGLEVPSSVTFAIVRHSSSGEVKLVSRIRS
jgi:hypothetical protein